MARKPKIKLTFHRCNYGFSRPQYKLDQIENSAVATDTGGVLYRVGNVLDESAVRDFAENFREYEVKVKS